MVTTSSLVRKPSGSNAGSLITSIVRSGLMRPGIRPIWGPSGPSGNARENVFPVLIKLPARFTTSGVMRLMVPSSSSAPHRPQLLTDLASWWNSSGMGMTAILIQNYAAAPLHGDGQLGGLHGETPVVEWAPREAGRHAPVTPLGSPGPAEGLGVGNAAHAGRELDLQRGAVLCHHLHGQQGHRRPDVTAGPLLPPDP